MITEATTADDADDQLGDATPADEPAADGPTPPPDITVRGASLARALELARDSCRADLERTEKRVREIFHSAATLELAGFPTSISEHSRYSLYLHDFPTSRLPELRKTLGPMRVACKDVKSVEDRTVTVSLRFAEHPHVEASYTKTLPQPVEGQPRPRCRIVETVHVSHALVCERPS